MAPLPLLFGLAGQAQDYLANNPIWRMSSSCAIPYPCIAHDDYNYRTSGDSLIDGSVWTKLIREGWVSLVWNGSFPLPQDCQGGYTYGPEEYGTTLIRQTGRQLRILDSGIDQLLYDFDLQVGDTLPTSWNNWGNAVTVIGVDSILIGPDVRALYTLANGSAIYLIEGVGSSNGLLELIADFFECGYHLDCFGLDTVGFYPVVENVPCDINLGISASPQPVQPVAHPNPGTDQFTLTLALCPHAITVLDVTGRPVLQQNMTGASATIGTTTWPPGIYVVRINDGLQPIRWVKQ